jgi:hypothetical protein
MKEALLKINNTWYIDAMQFLHVLNERARLVTERIVVPGVDLPTTEGLRGRCGELTTLIQQLKETINEH